jgi:hypothetical protein
MTNVDLSGPLLKLDRAEKHIAELFANVELFTSADPPPFGYREFKTPLPNGAIDYRIRACIRSTPPPDWAPIIGDAIHNIHSALDLLLWQMAPNKLRRLRPTFPIYTKREDFEDNESFLLRVLDPGHAAIITAVQPFLSGHPEHHSLAVLRKLANQDKHRLLVSFLTARNVEWIAYDNADVALTYINDHLLQDGDTVMRFTATPRDPNKPMMIHPFSAFRVAIAEVVSGPYIDVVGMLHDLHWYVREWIIRHPLEFGLGAPQPFALP